MTDLATAKMEIRSILITFQKGCSLTDFKKEYWKLIGRKLPFTDFGYKNDVDFLKSIYDVVSVRPLSNGDYHLYGIADENTQHIQKMVCKQKPSKQKPSRQPIFQLRSVHRVPIHPVHPMQLPVRQSTVQLYGCRRPMQLPVHQVAKQLPVHQASKQLPVYHAPKQLSVHQTPAQPAVHRTPAQPTVCTASTQHPVHSASIQTPVHLASVQPLVYSASVQPSVYSASIQPKKNLEKYELPPRFRTTNRKKRLPPSLERDVIDLVSRYTGGLSLRNFFPSFELHYRRKFSFRDYEFFTLEECIDTISELTLKTKNNDILIYSNKTPKLVENVATLPVKMDSGLNFTRDKTDSKSSTIAEATKVSASFVKFEDNLISKPGTSGGHTKSHDLLNLSQPKPFGGLQDFPDTNAQNESYVYDLNPSSLKNNLNCLDSFDLDTKNVEGGISENTRRNLKKVLERNPHGIWAIDFPSVYEDTIRVPFDLHSLGYNDLGCFIDAVPDIFIRKNVTGSRKSWLIYPADSFEDESIDSSFPKTGVLLIEYIILNTRRILQGYPEGIKLNEFLHIYGINCTEPLRMVDLGFDDIENFLLSIAERVPLKLTKDGNWKYVHLVQFADVKLSVPLPENDLKESLPYDAVTPDIQIPCVTLPSDFDSSYFPVFTSHIENPGLFYIQLEGPDTSDALTKVYNDIDNFYQGHCGNAYQMKNGHIKLGAQCIAQWPHDQHWYRSKVISIESMELVQVFYYDWGTTAKIPKTLLRYLTKEFIELPTQALKCRLSYLKPANNASNWDIKARSRMLNLCQDKSLMAKIEQKNDDVLAIVLCDTNGERDTFINDILLEEHLAEADIGEETTPTSIPSPQVQTTLQIQQAQFLLQAYAAVTSNFTADGIAQLMQNLTLGGVSQPLIPPPLPAAASAFLASAEIKPLGTSVFNDSNSSSMQLGLNFSETRSPFSAPVPKAQTLNKLMYTVDTLSQNSSTNEIEVFDDDDELFEHFFHKATTIPKRFVKRIRTQDLYSFHILNVELEPYVSSGDLSSIIWNNKEADYLQIRLQHKEIILPSRTLTDDEDSDMFKQFERFHVKGVQKISGTSHILVYPMKNVIQVLNMFGHPSINLRATIVDEIANFDPKSSLWLELTETEMPDEEEDEEASCGVTDDDKLNRLCLYDLLAMKDSIRVRLNGLKTKKLENNSISLQEEIKKLEELYHKVVQRIEQIKKICTMFSKMFAVC